MKIPDFIQELINENKELDWVEEQDQLEFHFESSYNRKNQIDWWMKNVEIRDAIKKIENQIRDLKKRNEKISKRIVTWSNIAALAKCDRATLTHPKRKNWVQERIDFLEDLVKNDKDSSAPESNPVSELEQQIIELKEQVIKARNETSKWYDKVSIVEKNYKMLLNALKKKDNDIFDRDMEIKKLYEKLKVD
jgi:chromosome segregation ATPase